MINPVTKAINKAAREQYYGFLGHGGTLAPRDHYGRPGDSGKDFGGYGRSGETGGSRIPAKPKKPTPTMGAQKALPRKESRV